MISKTNRLHKEKDIKAVLEKGKGFKEDFLILKTYKNDLPESRFTFIVSKKVSKKATVRNKIKRRLRSLIQINLDKIKSGTDNVFIAASGLEGKDFWEMEESMNKIFARAKLFKLQDK